MRSLARSAMLLVLALLLLVSLSCAQQADLKVGDKAPGFRLAASDGREYTLAEFAGEKAVVVCWFPRAGSGGAKIQCAALEAAMGQVPPEKVQVFGCSTASLDATTTFARDGKYSFPVLSDADHTAARAFGCLRDDGLSERWTFVIDEQGTIRGLNKTTTPQSQGADLVKMLTEAGLMAKAAGPAGQPVARPAAAAPDLKPGTWFTVKFPEMPPTLFALSTGRPDPAQMTVFLPRNYDPQRKHPLLILLNGSDGGNASNPGMARTLSEEQDFVCVALPLFKVSLDPAAPDNAPPLIIVRGGDGRFAWPLYRTMLTKLEELVPNLDPVRRILGGFSNGAHATAALLDGSDGEVARFFSAFIFVEGGGKLQHYELLKGKPVLMLSSNAKSLPRAQEIIDAARAAGAETTLVFEDIGQHGFPPASYPAVRAWLRGPALGADTPAAGGGGG